MYMSNSYQRDIGELVRIVADTDQFFSLNGINHSLRMVVDLATEELFVNMVKYNTETQSLIRIEMLHIENGIEVSLTDYDVERFDPTRAPAVDINANLAERSPGGLGIYLVLKMTDSIQYEYAGRESRVTFRKKADHSNV